MPGVFDEVEALLLGGSTSDGAAARLLLMRDLPILDWLNTSKPL